MYIELKVLDLRVPWTVFCVSFNRNVIYQDHQSQLFWLALALTSKYNKELVQFVSLLQGYATVNTRNIVERLLYIPGQGHWKVTCIFCTRNESQTSKWFFNTNLGSLAFLCLVKTFPMYTAQCWGNSLAVDGLTRKPFLKHKNCFERKKNTCRSVLGHMVVPCL